MTLLSLEKNMCQLDDPASKPSSGRDITHRRDRLDVPQHVQYACVHWAVHLREACRPGEEHAGKECCYGNLVELLERFISEGVPQWLEILVSMGRVRVDNATDDLLDARNWLPSDVCTQPPLFRFICRDIY